MTKFLNLTLLLLFTTSFFLFGQETRVIKGMITEGENEILIGATVQEFEDIQNYSLDLLPFENAYMKFEFFR